MCKEAQRKGEQRKFQQDTYKQTKLNNTVEVILCKRHTFRHFLSLRLVKQINQVTENQSYASLFFKKIIITIELPPIVMTNVTKQPLQQEGSATVTVKSSYYKNLAPYILLNFSNETTENAMGSTDLTSKSKLYDENHFSAVFPYHIKE